MDGTIAQLLSLVSYGHEYIVHGDLEIDYYPKNSVFKYCKNVNFYELKLAVFKKDKKIILGNNPREWFQFLKSDGCKKLKAFYQHTKQQGKIKDYMIGGGQWFIESDYDDYSDFWRAHWDIGNRDDPENKIWVVSYELAARRKKVQGQQVILSRSLTLEEKLKEIELFARENGYDSWADWFTKALDTFESERPYELFYHPDMIVLKNYPLQTQQMVFGACKAWVFGGMGSWSDLLGFSNKEIEEKYYKLTEELFDEIVFSLINGVNR